MVVDEKRLFCVSSDFFLIAEKKGPKIMSSQKPAKSAQSNLPLSRRQVFSALVAPPAQSPSQAADVACPRCAATQSPDHAFALTSRLRTILRTTRKRRECFVALAHTNVFTRLKTEQVRAKASTTRSRRIESRGGVSFDLVAVTTNEPRNRQRCGTHPSTLPSPLWPS